MHKKVSTSIATLCFWNPLYPSRAFLNNSTPKIEDTEIKCYVHTTESNYLISDYRLQLFQHKTKTDESLQTLLTFIQNGWPKNPDQTPETVCP